MVIARQMVIIAVIAALAMASFGYAAEAQKNETEETPDVAPMVYDALLVRPFGAIAMIVGAGVFVVSLPFSAAFEGGVKTSLQKMVIEPAVYTFKRPLGKF